METPPVAATRTINPNPYNKNIYKDKPHRPRRRYPVHAPGESQAKSWTLFPGGEASNLPGRGRALAELEDLEIFPAVAHERQL